MESQDNGTDVPSLRILPLYQERMRQVGDYPWMDHCLEFSSALLTLLVGWQEGRLLQKTFAAYPERLSFWELANSEVREDHRQLCNGLFSRTSWILMK